jgi:hypothetical protein
MKLLCFTAVLLSSQFFSRSVQCNVGQTYGLDVKNPKTKKHGKFLLENLFENSNFRDYNKKINITTDIKKVHI